MMEITIRNKDLIKTELVDVVDSFLWTDRYNTFGDYVLNTNINIKYVQAFQEDFFLSIPESEHTMIVESVEINTDVENGNKFISKGRSLETILERRIVWKLTVLSGSLQDGIKRLLYENAIEPEDPDRQMLRLVFEETDDPYIASRSIDDQLYGENLYDVISKLCRQNQVGFKITLSTDNLFIFKLYVGKDRSTNQLDNETVVFSPNLDNLNGSNYFHSKANHRTISLVAGEGSGSDRLTTQVSLPGGAGVDLDRRELFTDASGISSMVDGQQLTLEQYNTLLTQNGIFNLLDNQATSSFDGRVDPSSQFVYDTHFKLGDIVQIENEFGMSGRSRVTELIISEDPSGYDKYPTFEVVE